MILVTGAGGKTGVAVLKALVARGAFVRALVRSNSHRAALNAIGVHDIVVGEMDDPRVWSQAVAGTNAVYHICPNMSPQELPFARALVAAAVTHGVRRLVDLDDVAEAAALVLTEAGHSGASYELVGTTPMSQIEVAETFGRALQRDVRAEAEPIEVWNHRARNAGMGDYQRETLMKMFQAYARDGLKGNPNVLGWLLKRPPTSLAAFAARMAATHA